MLLPFAGFLLRHHYAWDAEPERVRWYLIEFLRNDVGCSVRPDAEEGDGYLVETTGRSPLSKSSLGVLLAALTSLYQVLSAAGYYRYPNPLRSEHLQALKREHLRGVKNAGAPEHAGIRGETWAETRRYPTNFIRQHRGKVWEPQLAMEPDAVQEQMRKAVDWMIAHAPTLRDQVVLRLLRTTGARLTEILSLTAGGYRGAGHSCQALITNKGSQGREEKRIYFTGSIEEALIKYIRTERSKYDPQGYTRLEQLDAADSIFLTAAGTPYTRSAFYYHWYSLLKSVQSRFHLAFSPHDLRHLHVTSNIAKIEQKAQGDRQLEAQLREGFWRLMGWSSAETMEIYIHVLKKRQALLEIVLAEDESVPARILPKAPPQSAAQRELSSSLQVSPQGGEISFEKDDLSWYEE
jgi:site-specific recombinase XerD